MILSKIRERKFFLIFMIGLALFAFVISGVFENRNQRTTLNIGEVNGDEISYESFRMQVENTMANMGRNNSISTNYIVNMLWQQAVQGKILDQQFEKLGITIGKDQIFSAIRQSPSISQDPQFLNANGVFDPNKFSQFIANLKATNPAMFRQWQQQEEQLAESAKRQMYLTLVRSGLGATASEGENAYHQEADKVDIKFVTLPYSTISDEEIKVTDAEIKEYLSKHTKEYEQKEGRNIQFVVLREEATDQDKRDIFAQLQGLNKPQIRYNSLKQANDTLAGFSLVPVSEISEFVTKNSDNPYDSLYVTKDRLLSTVADDLFNLPINGIYGPYEENGYYKLSRMLSKLSNAEVKASHILISYKDAPNAAMVGNITLSKEDARAKAASILEKATKNNADFAELARENSDDKSSSDGDLNFFQRGAMVKPFNDYVFSHKVGDIGMVETDFGFHIIKITDQREGVRLATITRLIEPSQATRDEVFAKIGTFEVDASKNATKFSEIAQKQNLSVLPAEKLEASGETITGLGDNRAIVQWAFNEDSKVGDVRRFDIKDGYVVAQLTKKIEKGAPELNEARILIEPILKKQKKAVKLIERMKGNTLDEIATNVQQNNIRLGENLSIKSATILGVGLEPNVVGTAFAMPLNKLSKPIEGENGVYVIEVTKKTIAPSLPSYASYTNALKSTKLNRASIDLFRALEETAEIEDNRNLFY